MNHADVLKLLFPVEIGGVHDAGTAVEGRQLDAAQASAQGLLAEMFPDTAADLPTWERCLGLPSPHGGPLPTEDARKRAVMARLRDRGGQSRPYFIALAASIGYEITIEEYRPYCCIMPVDQPIYGEEAAYLWRAHAPETTVFVATCQSGCSEPMRSWGNGMLEDLLTEAKPAHTQVVFSYE